MRSPETLPEPKFKMIVLKLDGACVVKGERGKEKVYEMDEWIDGWMDGEMDGWRGGSWGWREKRAIRTSRWMMELAWTDQK